MENNFSKESIRVYDLAPSIVFVERFYSRGFTVVI